MASAPVVAILGAGFAGCATAWALDRRGIRAVVFEREPELGRSASGRGAGLGRQLCEDDATSALAIRGAELHRTMLATSWSPTGGILCFEEATHANAYVTRAQRLAVAHAVLDRAAVLQAWPQLVQLPVAAALHVPSDGVIDAIGLLRALAATIDLRLATPVTAVEPTATGARVVTTSAALDVRVVVDATGAWAGSLTGDPPLEVYKRHLFVVEATAATAAPYVWHLGTNELYLRRDANGVLVSPCDGDVTPPRERHEPAADADSRLRARLLPTTLGTAPIVRRWACQRAFTADRRMRLGRDPERPWLVWAAALGGHGATAAPAVGETVADAVLEALG